MTINILKRALEKYGYIYGISYKYDHGSWHWYCKTFTTLTEAKIWLETEECDFRERVLLTESKAIKMFGNNFKEGK